MEVVEKTQVRTCLHCSGKLLSDNRNALCGPCLTRWRREHPTEVPPQPKEYRGTGERRTDPVFPSPETACDEGHVLQATGYTVKGECYACGMFRAEAGRRPKIRYFYLPGLTGCLGDLSASHLAGLVGVSAYAIREYRYAPHRAPENTARVIAAVLDVSIDELKWVS